MSNNNNMQMTADTTTPMQKEQVAQCQQVIVQFTTKKRNFRKVLNNLCKKYIDATPEKGSVEHTNSIVEIFQCTLELWVCDDLIKAARKDIATIFQVKGEPKPKRERPPRAKKVKKEKKEEEEVVDAEPKPRKAKRSRKKKSKKFSDAEDDDVPEPLTLERS